MLYVEVDNRSEWESSRCSKLTRINRILRFVFDKGEGGQTNDPSGRYQLNRSGLICYGGFRITHACRPGGSDIVEKGPTVVSVDNDSRNYP